MPWLAQLREQYAGQGFEILGILTDDAGPGRIMTILRRSAVGYPIARCDHATAQKYGGLPYLPVSFYISRRGKVIDVTIGSNSKPEIESLIRKTLGFTRHLR
jgi:cytochrome c biogenesis protein CcmG/thiol:disulfide interchange protein DsbE